MYANCLNNAQPEILKMFSKPMNKRDLADLRKTLIEFLSEKIDEEVDQLWDKRKLSQNKLDKILKTHLKRK
jgi:hypothetical protein